MSLDKFSSRDKGSSQIKFLSQGRGFVKSKVSQDKGIFESRRKIWSDARVKKVGQVKWDSKVKSKTWASQGNFKVKSGQSSQVKEIRQVEVNLQTKPSKNERVN
ncbi:CLUMA_CG002163, isoform A [Clunio marinus]|uniref:CLUMA_CG002163, isoform A n=1 Tax=Clunio marinus TaxID=568069 RepID=A0A1J1HLG5_9DIPT|nr:CLUMA_CG002163, isoform A [Clunio marinus]